MVTVMLVFAHRRNPTVIPPSDDALAGNESAGLGGQKTAAPAMSSGSPCGRRGSRVSRASAAESVPQSPGEVVRVIPGDDRIDADIVRLKRHGELRTSLPVPPPGI